jgi:hypothetical protein
MDVKTHRPLIQARERKRGNRWNSAALGFQMNTYRVAIGIGKYLHLFTYIFT